jgi:hypothetical protein
MQSVARVIKKTKRKRNKSRRVQKINSKFGDSLAFVFLHYAVVFLFFFVGFVRLPPLQTLHISIFYMAVTQVFSQAPALPFEMPVQYGSF